MTSYLRSKLEDGDAGKTVFPVRCPECKVEEWQMSDGEAEKILGTDDMVKWVGFDSFGFWNLPSLTISRCG
jgi:hypothetical protein